MKRQKRHGFKVSENHAITIAAELIVLRYMPEIDHIMDLVKADLDMVTGCQFFFDKVIDNFAEKALREMVIARVNGSLTNMKKKDIEKQINKISDEIWNEK